MKSSGPCFQLHWKYCRAVFLMHFLLRIRNVNQLSRSDQMFPTCELQMNLRGLPPVLTARKESPEIFLFHCSIWWWDRKDWDLPKQILVESLLGALEMIWRTYLSWISLLNHSDTLAEDVPSSRMHCRLRGVIQRQGLDENSESPRSYCRLNTLSLPDRCVSSKRTSLSQCNSWQRGVSL